MAVGQIISRAIAPGAVTSDDIADTTITHAKLHTDMDLSTKTVTMPASVRGPATLTIDPAAVGDNTGLVVIAGDLQVDGTTTTINSTTMTVDDKNLVLASGAGNASAADGAGLTIDGASATMLYTHATTSFDFNKPVNIAGNLGVTGTVDGVDIAARDAVLTSTTTTANASLPKAGGAMTGTVTVNTGGGDATNTSHLGGDFSTWIRIGDPNTSQTQTNGFGIKLHDAGVIHWSVGGLGTDFKISRTNTNGDQLFPAGSLDALTINSSGKVGIGTTNPASKLDVNGAIHISTDTAGKNTFRLTSNAANDANLIMKSDTTDKVQIQANGVSYFNGGNVGIGTTNPSALQQNYIDSGSANLALRLTQNNSGQGIWMEFQPGNNTDDWQVGANGEGFVIYNATDSRYDITIDNTGKVGIGTQSPAQNLTVYNATASNFEVRSSNKFVGLNASSSYRPELWWQQGQTLGFGTATDGAGSGYDNKMVITSTGNVGIGTTGPVTKLDISAGTTSGTMYNALILRGGQNSTQGSGVRLHMTGTENDPLARGVILQSEMTNNGNNHDFSVWTSQASSHTKKFTIDNQGQVAIGTDAPSGTRLHIKVPGSSGGLINAVKIQDSGGYVDIEMHAGAADGEIRLGSAGQLRGKISGAGVGSRTDHNFDLYQNSTTAARLMSSINSTGRRGLTMFGNSLGFDESGIRSWEMRAEGGNLRMDSGDGYGKVQVSAGFKAKSIQLGSDGTSSTFSAQSGYLGDDWEAGHKAVYYLGYLGSSASAAGTANWFNFYTSGHWGQYTRVMIYSINHYPSPGYSKWDVNGTTVTQLAGSRGSVGSVSVSQSTVSSNGHGGQPVYKYTVTLTMPGTYTQGPWFVAHTGGGGAGHLSNAQNDAQADAWFSTRGGGMHLRNVSTDAMKTSPMYVTGT